MGYAECVKRENHLGIWDSAADVLTFPGMTVQGNLRFAVNFILNFAAVTMSLQRHLPLRRRLFIHTH